MTIKETKEEKIMPTSLTEIRAKLTKEENDAINVLLYEISNDGSFSQLTSGKLDVNKYEPYLKNDKCSPANIIKNINTGVKGLYNKSISVDGKTESRLLHSYIENENLIEVGLTPYFHRVLAYEVNKTDSTNANLIYTLLLNTKEAKILYSMILHSKRQGKREDEMLILKTKLGIQDNKKTSNAMQVVNNAVEEINRKTPVHVSIEVKENNKEIERVIFTIADRKGFKKPDPVMKEKKPEPKKYLEKPIKKKNKTNKKKGN